MTKVDTRCTATLNICISYKIIFKVPHMTKQQDNSIVREFYAKNQPLPQNFDLNYYIQVQNLRNGGQRGVGMTS